MEIISDANPGRTLFLGETLVLAFLGESAGLSIRNPLTCFGLRLSDFVYPGYTEPRKVKRVATAFPEGLMAGRGNLG